MKICFGIDINGSESVVVRAEKVRGRTSTEVVSLSSIEKGSVFAGSVNAHGSFTRWVETPFASVSKARKVLPTLLDIQLPFPLEECICEFISIEPADGSVRALGVGARVSDISDRISEYERLGVDTQIIDHDGLALWGKGLDEAPVLPSEADQPRVMAHLCEERYILALGIGKRFVSAHSVRADDTGRISRLLEVGFKGSDLSRARWIFSGSRVEERSAVAEFLETVASGCNAHHNVVNDPAAFLARAFAVRGVDGNCVNLRSGSLMHKDILAGQRRSKLAPVFLSIIAGVLLIGSNIAASSVMAMKKDKLNEQFTALASEVAGYRIAAKGDYALQKVRNKVDEREAGSRPFLRGFGSSLTGLIKEIMDAGVKSGLQYEVISVSALTQNADRDSSVLVKGTAKDWNASSELESLLRKRGYNVSVDRNDALADERIPFVLRSGGIK